MTSLVAWIAPLLLGMGLWVLAMGRPRQHADWCAMLGTGWLAGLLATGWLLGLFSGLVSPRDSVSHLGPWLILGGVVAVACGWRWRSPEPRMLAGTASLQVRLLVAVLLALLLWQGWLLASEAIARPVFPWDAWLVWSVKPKTWFGLDQWVPFVNLADWLAAPAANVHTDAAPVYPDLMTRLEVWFASGAGCWCDPAFTILWPTLWASLLLGGYGLLRRAGCTLLVAFCAMFALGTLPMLATHTALAGYADLWVASAFGLALLCWLPWQRERHVGALLLALLFGLSLPALKLEGSIWMLLWLLTLVIGLLPTHWRTSTAVGGAALVFVLLLAGVFGGIGIPLPGMGWVHIDATSVDISNMPRYQLGWQGVTLPVLRSLFILPNWNLLFWIAPVLLLLRWRQIRRNTGIGLIAICLLGSAVFLFVLFFFTNAGEWAASYTAFNRLVLHIVPALVFLMALTFATETDVNWRRYSGTTPARHPPTPSS